MQIWKYRTRQSALSNSNFDTFFKCRRTQWTIYWNRVHHRINWYSAFNLEEGHLLWRIEICTKSILNRMELDCKDRTVWQMDILDTKRCVGLYNNTIQIFKKLLQINFNLNRSAKKSMKINRVLINGLNDGTTSLKFLLCIKAKIGFRTTTRKASPSRYTINI